MLRAISVGVELGFLSRAEDRALQFPRSCLLADHGGLPAISKEQVGVLAHCDDINVMALAQQAAGSALEKVE
eukprot:3914816-Lingulodinium_polyedra.AAC.1